MPSFLGSRYASRPPLWDGLHWLAAAVFTVALAFCGTYLLTSYATLARWYTTANGCFYRAAAWQTEFFTPATKAQGNLFCALGAALSSGGLAYVIYRLRTRPAVSVATPARIRATRADRLPLLLLLTAAAALWGWGQSLVAPAFDEAFSAVHCAALPPWQTLSYYMLPNNHVLFNLLNGLLFRAADDLVATGRVLSGLAYAATLACAYFWLLSLCQHRAVALLGALLLALQFPLWGFGFQARGYALYGLAHWVALVTLFRYQTSQDVRWLPLNALACWVGYATVPSFLYFYAAQTTYMAGRQLVRRSIDWHFWRYQAWALVGVFLFYLPALSFSGLPALADNRYVKPMADNVAAFIPMLTPILDSYAEYGFANAVLLDQSLGKALLALPLLLLFAHRRSVWFSLGCFYAVLLMTLVLAMLGMKRYTFHRNLIGHFSLVLALVLLTGYWLLTQLTRWMLPARAVPPLFALGVLPLLVHFSSSNPQIAATNLYYFDVNASHEAAQTVLRNCLPGGSISFSNESFYLHYLAQNQNRRCFFACQSAETDYRITTTAEQAGRQAPAGYLLLAATDDYLLFQRQW